ncbi:MAG: hypothetical protein AVDCRST_MAG77-443 [uncultured Chloroflexi bacterium]|uniref:Uncharacterized protein n=1 Tax=uncultured Chloroflexota bacterium TaxID=166587 RepID=A0A6J4HC45_9CHLR|nr:MAG: hypothetical protein AVDCRST_MAG77-443 [uncultured Chloroflexota bacterium]
MPDPASRTIEAARERPFRVGLVVGEHPHALMHAATLRVLDDVQLVTPCVVADREDPGAITAALGNKAAAPVGLDALLESDVDALLVAVRNDLCPALLERAVAAGKPALFEKPGAPSAAVLAAVARRARARGVTLGAILPWRYHPISREVRSLIAGGALGRVMSVEARMVTSQVRYRDPAHWLFDPERAGSGILSWLGIHWLDLLSFLLGQRVRRVTALAGALNPERPAVEDTACLALEYDGGALGTLHAGYLLPGSQSGYSGAAYDTHLAVRGYEGWVSWPGADPPRYSLFSVAPGHAAESGAPQERVFALRPSAAYSGEHGEAFVRDFLRAGRAGAPPPCPIEDAVHALEVVDAALRAVTTGVTQTVGSARKDNAP